MSQHIYIIHGWDDGPGNGWFPWIKKELTQRGKKVTIPAMPDPAHPLIDTWVPFLKRLIKLPNEETILVGHSVGGQAALRYLETLPAGVKIGGLILVAAWLHLKPEILEDEETMAIATPWIERPLNWPKIRSHVDKATVIMSDDDQFVPVEDGKVLARELGAKLVVEHHKRHISGADGITALSSLLFELE